MLTVEEIKSFIERDKASGEKLRALEGERYYEAKHDILAFRVFYIDANGEPKEDKTRSNIRIPHAFFTELIDQKTQYLLSGDAPLVRAKGKAEELQKELDAYFGGHFLVELGDLVTHSSMHGWGFFYGYREADNRTRFTFADALHTVEVGAKEASDGKEHLIYFHTEKTGMKDSVTRVQVWDDQEAHYYVSSAKDGSIGTLEADPEVKPNPRPHILLDDGENRYRESYGRIPFFRLDNDKRRRSDLSRVKALIDDYDLMACGLSNNLQDVAEGIYVVRGFEGNSLDELITNIKAKKAIGVSDEGGVDVKTINVPYEARKIKLELDEKNIYRFGQGFNAAQVGDGNITNIVIKSRYALLDLKCDKAEKRVRALLDQLVKIALEEINGRTAKGWQQADVEYHFERKVIANDTDQATIRKTDAETLLAQVNTVMGVQSVLGAEVVAEEVCKLLKLDYEKIKDRLPEEPYDLNAASKIVEGPRAGEDV